MDGRKEQPKKGTLAHFIELKKSKQARMDQQQLSLEEDTGHDNTSMEIVPAELNVETNPWCCAKQALQGYKFDDKKPDSPLLKFHFAHFPFRLPSDRDDQRFGGLR